MAELRSIFNRDVTLSYRMAQPERATPFWTSGAFTSDSRIRSLLATGLRTFTVPYVNGIDTKLEPNYSNTIMTDFAIPRQIDGGKSTGRAAYLNEAFLESSLERYLLGESPLQMMAGMIDGLWTAQAENRAIATVAGLYNYAKKNKAADFILDVSKATADATSTFNIDHFIDAEAMLPKATRGNGIMIVHPKKAAEMRKQQLLEKIAPSNNLPVVENYNGRTVIESTDLTVVGTGANAKYITYLLGQGAFIADSVAGNDDMEVERTASTGNGAGHTILHTRRNMLIHPQNFSFIATDAQLTGGTTNEALSASWTDLQNADYWQLDGKADTSSIRFLVTNQEIKI